VFEGVLKVFQGPSSNLRFFKVFKVF
jgi:hypothetical protein